MWNCRVLKPPLYCEIKTTLKQDEIGCLYEVRKSLKKSEVSISDHMNLLTTEHYMVKRVIYKLANQLRSDKALKTIKQVHTCMKRLEGVDIVKQMKESIQLVERVSCDRDETEYYLPSRQVLEYLLVILQGTGALLRQTLQYCQKTFIHVRHHLEIGNLISQNLLMLALISRIWYVCNSLGLYVCKWYSKLYGCLAFFKPTIVPWNEELPRDLAAWLAELFKETDHTEEKIMESVEAEKASGSLPTSVQYLESADQEDVGEPIQRKTVVEKSDNLQDKPSTITNDVDVYCNKRKIENNNKDNEIQVSRKKKQKILKSEEKTSTDEDLKKMNTMEELDSDQSDLSNDEDNKTSMMYEPLGVNFKDSGSMEDRLPTTLSDIDITSVSDVKTHLENVLQTYDDFDKCVEQIKCGTFKISESCLKFSKSAKKKILKNIDKWKNSMTNKNSEKLFLKKVRGPLSQMIVKLNLIPREEQIEKKIELHSDQKVDVCNKEALFHIKVVK